MNSDRPVVLVVGATGRTGGSSSRPPPAMTCSHGHSSATRTDDPANLPLSREPDSVKTDISYQSSLKRRVSDMDKTISYWTAPRPEDAALPSSHDGWFVVEVDVPDPPVKEEPTAQSARWILAQPERRASV